MRKNFWKKLISLAAAASLALSLAGCGNAQSGQNGEKDAPAAQEQPEAQQEETGAEQPPQQTAGEKTLMNIAALKGPTALGMLNLMEQNDNGQAANRYQFTLAGAPDEIVGKITTGELDLAAVPTNLAATLYNKTQGGVKLLALNTMGVLYIVEKGDTVQSVADLEGKTVYATGQGSTPEYALNMILAANGLTPGENVTVEYKQEHAEILPLMLSGQAQIAMLPQPFVTSALEKDPEIRVALDLTQEWDKATDSQSGLTMGCVLVRSEFLEENREAVDRFLDEYRESVELANSDAGLEHTAQLAQQYDVMTQEVALKAIPECNIVFVEGDEMQRIASGCLQVLYDADPKSVGGTLPDDAFYYKR